MAIVQCAACGAQMDDAVGYCMKCKEGLDGHPGTRGVISAPPIYRDGNGEGILMFWCIATAIGSMIGGYYLASLTISLPNRFGLTDEVPVYGLIGGLSFMVGGLATSSLFYGLSKAIALLKFIAARSDGNQPQVTSQPNKAITNPQSADSASRNEKI